MDPDEKRQVLRDFNHRINNDLNALLAFIKLQRRFEMDEGQIITSSCVVIASISTIQNMMYGSDDAENRISVAESFNEFKKILNDYYDVQFTAQVEGDFSMNPKKMFHLLFLINEMVSLSNDISFNGAGDDRIDFRIEQNGGECILIYSDNGKSIGDAISKPDKRTILFEQLKKQIDATLDVNDSDVCVKFDL